MDELNESNLAECVGKVFRDCLFTEAELVGGRPPGEFVQVDGIIMTVGFHPERLESHRQDVIEILRYMPTQFFKGSGDGWSFLNLPMTKDDHQWGEHRNAEQLMMLAFGLKLGQYTMPRDMWKAFPGGMPFITFEALPA